MSIRRIGSIALLFALWVTPVQARPQLNLAAGDLDRLEQQGLQQYRQGEFRAALTTLQTLLQQAREQGNRQYERIALSAIGVTQRGLSNYDAALSAYQEAIAIGRETGDRDGEGTLLNNIGVIYEKLGRLQEALDIFQQALRRRQEEGDRRGEGQTYNSLGIVYNRLGQADRALTAYTQALAIAQQINNRADQAQVFGNRASAYSGIGRTSDAIDSYQQAIGLYRSIGNRPELAAMLDNFGELRGGLGQYAIALNLYQEALAIRQAVGDRAGVADTLSNLALLHRQLGQYDESIKQDLQAIDLYRSIGNSAGEASVLSEMGNTLRYQGDFTRSQQSIEQALSLQRTLGDRSAEANSLNNLGLLYQAQNQLDRARSNYEQSLQIARELDNHTGTAAALNNIGSIYDDQEQFQQAIDTYEQALSLVREAGDRAGEATTLNNIGASLLSLQRYAEAEQTLGKAIDLLDAMRPGLSDAEKVSIFETQASTYRLLQFALVEQNKVEPALEVAERSRARAFVDLLATRLAADTPMPIAATSPDIATIRQTAIDRNATLVEYTLIGDDRLYIWVVQPTGEIAIRQVSLQGLAAPFNQVAERTRVAAAIGRGAAVENLVSETRSSLRGSNETGATGTRPANRQLQQLHQILIAPIADLLPTDPTASVVFVPQAALFLVPFAALQNPDGQYLIQQHTISIAPAIQALSLTGERSNSSGIDLIVGNPTMPSLPVAPNEPPQPLPSLPGAEQEAKAVASVLNAPVLIGDQATETAVVAEMPQARIIHLATHGLLDGFEAEATPGAIALAPSDTADGFLNASEILNLQLQADLVVLSACDTGRGRITGDGVIGLSRSLLLAGASSVVVSLWAVPDDATAALMVEFYRQLEQQPNKAQALRQAMLTLIDQQQFASPRDWSAFFLIGAT